MILFQRVLAAFMCVTCLGGSHAAARQNQPPNIILIVADDLGYNELGSYGQLKIKTPNLDRLAAEGMRFTQFYSGSPVCAPSRCTLLTGKHPGHALIRDNKEVGKWGPQEPEGQWPLAAKEITIAEMLKPAGYSSGAFGKWGLGGPGSQGHPNFQGFDSFYGYLCQRVAHNYYPTHLWRNHDVDILENNHYFPAHQRLKEELESEHEYARYSGGDYAPTQIAAEALNFIRKNKDGPFFLYYPTVIPHLALQAPQEFIDLYPRDWDDKHYLGNQGYLPTPRPNATYAAMITYMDYNIGLMLDLIDELGLTQNTIVIFTSDNGTTYAGGVDMKFFNSLGNLRGRKGDLYEGGIRVPFIARWPGHIPPGTVSDHLAAFWDIMPTLADLSGTQSPADADGLSFVPTLLGQSDQPQPEYLYWEFAGYGGQQAVRIGKYKAIRRDLKKGNKTFALYDLSQDIGEQNDIADQHPQIMAQVRQIVQKAREPSALFPLPVADD